MPNFRSVAAVAVVAVVVAAADAVVAVAAVAAQRGCNLNKQGSIFTKRQLEYLSGDSSRLSHRLC